MEPHSCNHCQITLQGPHPAAQAGLRAERAWHYLELTRQHVAQAMADGCPLFLELSTGHSDEGSGKDQEQQEKPHSGYFLSYSWYDLLMGRGWLLCMKLGATLFGEGTPLWNSSFEAFELLGEEEMLAQKSDLKAAVTVDGCFPGKHPMNVDPNSLETYQIARAWIRECLTTHSHSVGSVKNNLPRRLLGISSTVDTYELCLVDTSSANLDRESVYVALSYCWGDGTQQPKTLRSTLRLSQGLIDFALLPKTIQDAVKVTSNLGYSYLWVDSLCIVQDDEEDISSEIARMPDIYSGAVVTIAASTAASANEGFLQRRSFGTDMIMHLRVQSHGSGLQNIGIVRLANGLIGRDDLPLDKRAWAFQEHALSSRILQYSNRQLRFICAEFNSKYSSGFTYTDGWSTLSHVTHTSLGVYPPLFSPGLRSIEENFWKMIVTTYTKRRLTLPKDRVLAVSGIATKLQKFHGQQVYVAGHWIGGTSVDLLWKALSKDFDRGHNVTHSDPNWLGPSWAWTGINGRAMWANTIDSVPAEQRREIASWQHLWTVTLAHRTLANTAAPFGAVREAVLGIKTLTRRLGVEHDHTSKRYRVVEDAFPISKHGQILIVPDNSIRCYDRALLASPVLLVLAHLYPWKWTGPNPNVFEIAQGLVLVEVSVDENKAVPRFERHGLFSAHTYDAKGERLLVDWFRSWEEMYVEVQ